MLINEYRGELIENQHQGKICIVKQLDDKFVTAYHYGDYKQYTYFRSCAKPFQAIPFLIRQLDKKYGLTNAEITVTLASHRGEQIHIDALQSIIKKADLNEDDMIMLPALPIDTQMRTNIIKSGAQMRKIYHNCAGKHLAMMILQRELTGKIDGYHLPNSPTGREILNTIAHICNVETNQIICGIDGCGVPVFALPMYHLSLAFLKLAHPSYEKDCATSLVLNQIQSVINQNPFMINGTNTICGQLNTHNNFVCKGGADGVYAFGLKKERLGISLKIDDGSTNTWPIIISEILNQLNIVDPSITKILTPLHPKKTNATNQTIGKYTPAFNLTKIG